MRAPALQRIDDAVTRAEDVFLWISHGVIATLIVADAMLTGSDHPAGCDGSRPMSSRTPMKIMRSRDCGTPKNIALSNLAFTTFNLAQTGFPDVMSNVTLSHYLVVSVIMFVMGLIGFLTRRNLIIMFLCTELMFQAAAIALVAFGRYHLNLSGQTFVIFILTVAAAEAAMALALIVLLYRRKESLSADEWQDMNG